MDWMPSGERALASRMETNMQTLSSRLDHLAGIYHIQLGPILLLLGVGFASSPLLAWIAGVLLFLSTANKLSRLRQGNLTS